jgi:hypothetical protein
MKFSFLIFTFSITSWVFANTNYTAKDFDSLAKQAGVLEENSGRLACRKDNIEGSVCSNCDITSNKDLKIDIQKLIS